jgi:hypothetical protein
MAVVGFAVLLFSGWNGLSMSCRQKLLSEGAKRRRDCSKSVEFSQSKWSPLSSQAYMHDPCVLAADAQQRSSSSSSRPHLQHCSSLPAAWQRRSMAQLA